MKVILLGLKNIASLFKIFSSERANVNFECMGNDDTPQFCFGQVIITYDMFRREKNIWWIILVNIFHSPPPPTHKSFINCPKNVEITFIISNKFTNLVTLFIKLKYCFNYCLCFKIIYWLNTLETEQLA